MTDPKLAQQQHQPVKVSITLTELYTIFVLGIFIGSAFFITKLMPGVFSVASYFGLLSLFHALEYLITVTFQPNRSSFDSFLLNHSTEYAAAIVAALAEYLLESFLFPGLKSWLCIFRYLGLIFALVGQLIRTLAMIEAKDNFSHTIAEKKQPSHGLVTTGIYKYMRHPSYTGFFFWSFGSQLVLGNPICLVGFYHVLFQFFTERIRFEEETLVKFFSTDYTRYKNNTWSGFFTIP